MRNTLHTSEVYQTKQDLTRAVELLSPSADTISATYISAATITAVVHILERNAAALRVAIQEGHCASFNELVADLEGDEILNVIGYSTD